MKWPNVLAFFWHLWISCAEILPCRIRRAPVKFAFRYTFGPNPARGLLLAFSRLVRPGFKDTVIERARCQDKTWSSLSQMLKLGQVFCKCKNLIKSLASARLLQVLKPELDKPSAFRKSPSTKFFGKQATEKEHRHGQNPVDPPRKVLKHLVWTRICALNFSPQARPSAKLQCLVSHGVQELLCLLRVGRSGEGA